MALVLTYVGIGGSIAKWLTKKQCRAGHPIVVIEGVTYRCVKEE